MNINDLLSKIKFDDAGLVPAVAQDVKTGAVLMLAYMNEESIRATLNTKRATYYSRSRKELWVKGATSGNVQQVVDMRYDCDGDSILLMVNQQGNACHTGEYSCFHNAMLEDGRGSFAGATAINEDYRTILDRRSHPVEGSYTNYLFDKGIDKMCKKIGEEAAEVIIAAKNGSREELKYEAADLVYHLLVVMAEIGLTPDELYRELEDRQKR